MAVHNFKELKIWQKSMELSEAIYLLTANFSNTEKYGLIVQMQKCAVSIPSNISEGSGRGTNDSFKYFLSVALGSAFELETQLLLSKRLNLAKDTNELVLNLNEIQKMIRGFQNSLN